MNDNLLYLKYIIVLKRNENKNLLNFKENLTKDLLHSI